MPMNESERSRGAGRHLREQVGHEDFGGDSSFGRLGSETLGYVVGDGYAQLGHASR